MDTNKQNTIKQIREIMETLRDIASNLDAEDGTEIRYEDNVALNNACYFLEEYIKILK